jgi:hypothetical protein
MKALWQRLIPLLRCWKILMPLKMNDAFKDAYLVLEKVAVLAEPIMLSPP